MVGAHHMIPEFNPNDYDPDNNVTEELLAVLIVAIPTFENARMETIIAGASKNYLNGTKIAYERLGENFVSSEVKDDVYSFLKTYKKQINEGYTIIQGEKVYWLRDRTLNERQKIFDIIKEGVTENKHQGVIIQEFKNYFSMQESQAEVIASNETRYVKARARDLTYKKSGVEKLRWITASHPCSVCEELDGRVFTWDDMPYQQPVHIHCLCDLEPVFY